ncbi:PaaI family thioesterase [Cupriavidus sp. 2SB]|uniref:PaaI family thioesterase n=1 Tax=Cupriavidus sp. 2SB TaxID=2502199 RepID=UPI0010F8BDA5|nr:PaaI family thioesterase [Cupriavidus sp. 2SB]
MPDQTVQTVDPRAMAMLESVLIGSPVARALGIRFGRVEIDHVELLLPFSMQNITAGDMVHGGVIATLIDVAGAAAAFTNVDQETVKGGATSSLSIQYLAPAKSAALRAVADVVRRGRRQVVTEVAVYAEAENERAALCAKALMSTALL